MNDNFLGVKVDRLHLVSNFSDYYIDKFTYNELEHKYGSSNSHNRVRELDSTHRILVQNRNRYANRYYNVQIQLYNHDSIINPPSDVLEVLSLSQYWQIKQIDFAFDFATPLKNTFSIKKNSATRIDNPKKWRDTGNYYVGGQKGQVRANVYNRIVKMKKDKMEAEFKGKEYNIEIPDHDITRFEIRLLKPKLITQPYIHLDNFTWIDDSIFSKYIFCPNIDVVSHIKGARKLLADISQVKGMSWSSIKGKKKLKKEVRDTLINNRFDFLQVYKQYEDELLQIVRDFIPYMGTGIETTDELVITK